MYDEPVGVETTHRSNCRHCGADIVRVNYQRGGRWMHVMGLDLYWQCKGSTTTAGPPNLAVLTGQVPVSGNQETS